ncbi:MAG: acetyltransferase [Hyphomicrobiales bacterium]
MSGIASKKQKRLAIWGAGGQAHVAIQVARTLPDWDVCALVDRTDRAGTVDGIPVFAERGFDPDTVDAFHIAIGDNAKRQEIAASIATLAPSLPAATLISPHAIIAARVTIQDGTLVMPGVVVNTNAKIGAHCIINTNAIVEHDCVIEEGASIGPGSVICGGCSLSYAASVGAGAIVLEQRTIGQAARVGAGAVVTRDVAPGATAIGLPARPVGSI